MRVLQITPYFVPAHCYGGPPRSIFSLCQGIREIGVDVTVLTTAANGASELPRDISSQDSYDGIPVHYLPRSFPKRHFVTRQLRRELARLLPEHDLAHIHGCWNYVSSSSMRWFRRAEYPYVLSPRGMLDIAGMKRSRLKKYIAYQLGERNNVRGAMALQASTPEEKTRIQRLDLGRPVTVIPNSLNLDEFKQLPNVKSARLKYRINPKETVFLYVGRLHPQKGLHTLIAAFRLVVQRRGGCRLLVVGGGNDEYRRTLERDFASLVESERVVFTGPLHGQERLAAYAAADVFATASECESFGMSIVEAMAAGLPVVVSQECPWPLLESWGAGFRLWRSAGTFAEACLRLIDDPSLRESMGKKGRQKAAGFGLVAVARQMLDWYAECLSKEIKNKEHICGSRASSCKAA